ncbi:MAG TPA: prolyl oligopeptidase family serine peptidase [Acidimicrobiia bacterium]|nr:prolyl oligopeptidase family serine peptidase [Acidimicrobiia bacterium]
MSERPFDVDAVAARLAALPDRRDFAFSPELGRVAWVDEAAVEWIDDAAPGRIGRVVFPEPLPAPVQLEIVAPDLIGLCRPTAAGLEVMALDLDLDPNAAGGTGSARTVADLATPQTCLLPRLPGADTQLLAVVGFDDTTTVWRVGWRDGTMTEAGRLPAPVNGGVWLDETGDRLAVNLEGESGRSSVYVVDFGAALGGSRRPCRGDTPRPPGTISRLFEASPDSEDRILLADPSTGRVVVTTDAFGYPAVGMAQPSAAPGVRFVEALEEGDEAGEPCALLPDGRTVVLRHENGVESHLRLADSETLQVAGPIPLPAGDVGTPVVVDGRRLRFPFSAPDEPWRPASFDLRTGAFAFDPLPRPSPAEELVTARVASFPSGAGPMPALVYPSAPGDGPLSGSGLAVVALHGGPIARYGPGLVPEFQLFARLGLPTVALNYPGSTGSGHEYTRSLFGRAGSIDVEAVASVVDGLAAEGRRVILYGESYGAFLALSVAAVRPCAGVIAWAPFASFESLGRSGSPEVRDLLTLLDGGNQPGSGRNLLTACRTLRGKVLISHGTADMRIPAAESRALARALRGRDGAGEHDVHFVAMDGQGHDLSGRPVLQHWYREIATFVVSLPESRTPAQRVHQAAGALSRRPREDQPERR